MKRAEKRNGGEKKAAPLKGWPGGPGNHQDSNSSLENPLNIVSDLVRNHGSIKAFTFAELSKPR
jgi:hypothetical protein